MTWPLKSSNRFLDFFKNRWPKKIIDEGTEEWVRGAKREIERMKTLDKIVLDWKERKVNDIDSNPLLCWYAVGFVHEHPRLYTIYPQFPVHPDGYTKAGDMPELYILFETLHGRDCNACFDGTAGNRVEDWKDAERWGDYYFKGKECLVHAYKTLDEAKDRAKVQIAHIVDLSEAYFPNQT